MSEHTKRRRNRGYTGILVLIALLGLAGCAAGPGSRWAGEVADTAGFFVGLWHGALLVVTLVVSFFTEEVRVYETHNGGVAYDIGFVLGVLAVYGKGIHFSLERGRRKDRDDVSERLEREVREKLSKRLEDEEEWKDLGEKLERKIKDRLRRWLDEEKQDSPPES